MSAAEYKHLRVSQRQDVQIVTLHRPQAMNALNSELLDELDQVIRNVKHDPATSILIITGAGEKAFCAGADLVELKDLDYFAAKRLLEKGQTVFRQLELLGKPAIAAINGYALGGGLELALACTLRLASTNAKLALPEVKLGMIPGYGGTQRLPRLIGKGKALELMLTGRRIDAHEALSLGLVSRVVEPGGLLDAALALAEEILQGSMIAVSQLLQAVERGVDLPMDHALALETVLDAAAAASEDQREGIAAFLEKRQPLFRHRQKRSEER